MLRVGRRDGLREMALCSKEWWIVAVLNFYFEKRFVVLVPDRAFVVFVLTTAALLTQTRYHLISICLSDLDLMSRFVQLTLCPTHKSCPMRSICAFVSRFTFSHILLTGWSGAPPH